MSKSFPFEINAPWGRFYLKNNLELIECTLKQLEWMLETGVGKDTKELRDDINAYREILETGIVENADNYLRVRHENVSDGKLFKSCSQTVKEMKHRRVWKYQH